MAFKMKFSGFKSKGAIASQYAQQFVSGLSSLLQQKKQEKLEEEIETREENKNIMDRIKENDEKIKNFELNTKFDPSNFTLFQED